MADSIISCNSTQSAILQALKKAISPTFADVIAETRPLYGDMNASYRIRLLLKELDIGLGRAKVFYDL